MPLLILELGHWRRALSHMWLWVSWPIAYSLGSPRALLWLHRMHIVEAAAAILLMCIQLLLLLSFPGEPWDLASVEVILLFIFAFFPLFVTAIRMPVLRSTERRLRELVMSFERGESGVDRLLVQLLRGQSGRDNRLLSFLLVLWYAFSLFWEAAAPPCRNLSSFSLTAVPCESLAFTCTLLFNANLAFFLCALVAPDVVRRFREHFVPLAHRGIPANMLERLPSVEFGDPGAPGMGSECYICLEEFSAGDKMRHLPCGHHFHCRCVDEWLCRTPSCPLRCRNDIWGAVGVSGAGSWSGAGAGSVHGTAAELEAQPVDAGVAGRGAPAQAGVESPRGTVHGVLPAVGHGSFHSDSSGRYSLFITTTSSSTSNNVSTLPFTSTQGSPVLPMDASDDPSPTVSGVLNQDSLATASGVLILATTEVSSTGDQACEATACAGSTGAGEPRAPLGPLVAEGEGRCGDSATCRAVTAPCRIIERL